MKSIVWFRRDLRVEHNRSLNQAYGEVLPIFIFDKFILDSLPRDDKRVTFIFENVLKLKRELKDSNLDLAIFFGTPKVVFSYLKSFGFDRVYATCDNDKYSKKRDEEISREIDFIKVDDAFIFSHEEIKNGSNLPYRVFTPYYKKSLSILNESHYIQTQNSKKSLYSFDFDHIIEIDSTIKKTPIDIDSIGFVKSELPSFAKRSKDEIFAQIENGISSYEESRDYLWKEGSFKIGVFLRFGIISVREILKLLNRLQEDGAEVATFYKELVWREFYNYILYHFPYCEDRNFLDVKIAYINNQEDIEAWMEGKTGVPLVDAAMNELNSSGYMHNRARMVVASFFTKNLLCDWRIGERYFASKLLDYEASSNIGSWQWCAGTGVDAQPFFRIFNPYLQAKRFDKNSIYIKRWLKELNNLKTQDIDSESKLFEIDIKNYPKPLIDIRYSVNRAKSSFEK